MTQHAMEIVLEHAARAGATRVTDVHMVIGELTGASDECIAFYWDAVARGTLAQGAALHFRRVPFELECLDCGLSFPPQGDGFDCARCGSSRVRVARGEELSVEAIDVEEAPRDAEISERHAKARV